MRTTAGKAVVEALSAGEKSSALGARRLMDSKPDAAPKGMQHKKEGRFEE